MLPFLTLAAFAILILLYLFGFLKSPKASGHASLPSVPGWPLLGNLPQLKEKKPHKTFAYWADIYGPIYSIRLGASTVIVLNSTHVAKEAMVVKFPSISTRKLSKALNVLTQGKSMVATSDFDDFHKSAKRHLLASVVGPTAQKRFRSLRDSMMDSLSNRLREYCFGNPGVVVNFREIFEDELFSLSLKEALGTDVESIYVPEFKATVSKKGMLNILVHDMMEGAIDVDWRDFFPFLSWVPNARFDNKIERISFRRLAVMNALITMMKNRLAGGECYLKYLLENGQTLTEKQISMLVWEAIIEGSDTTLVAVEWALFELAKNPNLQDRLYNELKGVCGGEKLKEEHLSGLPYLNAVFHETLRKYSPAPIVPLRYVHEDTEIGGYKVAAGSEIAINIYGCNMDAEQWERPQEWKPGRFLEEKYVLNDLHKTMAFGAGKRACAGSLQAMLVGSMAIGRLVQEYQWKLSPGEEEDVDFLGLTTRKLHPLRALLQPRNL